MSRSNSISSEGIDPSNGIDYEIENELPENRSYKFTDFVSFDADADNYTDIEAYFDQLIADKAWLENYRKKRKDDNEKDERLAATLGWNKTVYNMV